MNQPGHISRAGDNLVVVEETAAAQIARVSRQFPADSNVAFACFQAAKCKVDTQSIWLTDWNTTTNGFVLLLYLYLYIEQILSKPPQAT